MRIRERIASDPSPSVFIFLFLTRFLFFNNGENVILDWFIFFFLLCMCDHDVRSNDFDIFAGLAQTCGFFMSLLIT